MNKIELKRKQLIRDALMGAEMRQGCTDYTPYVEILYNALCSEQVVCPKAKECGEDCTSLLHAEPHKRNDGCNETDHCPACIPVTSTPASVPLPPDELLLTDEEIEKIPYIKILLSRNEQMVKQFIGDEKGIDEAQKSAECVSTALKTAKDVSKAQLKKITDKYELKLKVN